MDKDKEILQQALINIQNRFADIEEAYTALKERFDEIDKLYTATSSLGAILDFDELLKFIKRFFSRILNFEQFCLLLFDSALHKHTLVLQHGLNTDKLKTLDLDISDSEYLRMSTKNKAHLYNADLSELAAGDITLREIFGVKGSLVILPLLSEEMTVLGTLILHRSQNHSLDRSENDFLSEVSKHLGYTLNKTLLFEHTKQLSLTDSLTGIHNRRYFEERFEVEVQRSIRYDRSLSLMMLDIDHFKFYNDKNGHVKGDVVLKKVAQILDTHLRKADVVARYGGEEFVILLPEISRQQAIKVANKLRKNIEKENFDYSETQPDGRLTVSLGIAVCPEDSADHDELLHLTDAALYAAKSQGRNCVAWHGSETIF
jgi:diguanylate cyclase (GGDEF)-like protein